MSQTVTITIDDRQYVVPAGTNLVDVAKFYADNDIPVFCYHPKMKPVGMCRMCLVEMGSVERDRATGSVVLDTAGEPKVRWMPKLQTACTATVYDGLVIRTNTANVEQARENVLEFILTSHPLDCPICDKGGECPLQNLTMTHGASASRMNFADKIHLDKHVPLGDLIYLDEERCIQCARCVRFQDEIVGDDVLAFHERGRTLQIITVSDPGFDTYFSGNTTDICPVGALTTADFRFGARPWELTNVPSICPHCPVGCNTTLSTRLDRDFGGRAAIKRVMSRQNEAVNEIWMCDKGRFGHHFTRDEARLHDPMTRNASGALVKIGWEAALKDAAAQIAAAAGDVAVIAGAGVTNEDLWMLRRMAGEGARLGAYPPTHAGADIVAQVGVGVGTNLKDLGAGDAVLIVASDLEEQAPIWRLRLKGAHDRGAYVVVADARKTRMADFSSAQARYAPGDAAAWLAGLRDREPAIAEALAGAQNLIIVAGADGLTLDGSRALMSAAANFLIETGHVGKVNNGLIGVFPGANAMGLGYMGYTPEATQAIAAQPPKVLIVADADLAGDDPQAAAWLAGVETIITLSLYADATARMARLALPIQSFAERDGSFVNGERRVQRFYTAQGPMGQALPTWQIAARIAEQMGQGRAPSSAAAVMKQIADQVDVFAGCRYAELGKVEKQFPDVGGQDNYYGGTAYKNTGGLGVQIASVAERETVEPFAVAVPPAPTGEGVLVIPTTRLYNRAATFRASEREVMSARISAPYVELNREDAEALGIADGALVEVHFDGGCVSARAHVDGVAPRGTALLPRALSDDAAPLSLTWATIKTVEG